jgi:DNA-binding LacI/PurR family transcriptional regulator
VAVRNRRVTSADIAQATGVSRATVSYVINGVTTQSISEATRARILAAAADLGYTPYGPAKTLATGKSSLVLLVLPDWPIGYGINLLLDELEKQLATNGLSLVMHRLARPGERVADAWKAIGPFAVIGLGGIDDVEAQAMTRAGVELVTMTLSGTGAPAAIGRPQIEIGRLQARHLARTGHSVLGYAFPDDDRVVAYSEPRLEGVRLACADLGLAEPVVLTVPQDAEKAAMAVRQWKSRGVTGICAYNDQFALAVLAGLYELGMRAPDDLAVVGCDNDPAGRLAAPPLTTIDINLEQTARRLAALVIGAYKGQPAPQNDGPLASRLVVRRSAP